jgi:hypothetical protein
MYKFSPRIIALPVVAGLAIVLAAFTTREAQPLAIENQPEDQMVRLGSDATLAVKASNGEAYQWLRNGVPVPGQTSPTLMLPKIQIKDAGNYSCVVSRGLQTLASRVAALLVYLKPQSGTAAATPGGGAAQPMGSGFPIMVYASPVASSGSSGSCPGPYAGYVNFSKTPVQGWGWTPSNSATFYMAADGGGRSDTIVQYMGAYGDSSCDETGVVIPHPAFSPVYRFMIYFPNNVPTTNYPIILTGFNP